MDKKYLMRGAATLLIGMAVVGCTHEMDVNEEKAQQALENAEATLGFRIPENQDWKMSSQANANITIPGLSSKTYTVKAYSNESVSDDVLYILAQQDVAGGQNFVAQFAYPSHLKTMLFGITDSEGSTVYKSAAITDDQITSFSDATVSRTRTITVNGDAYDKFPSAADVAAYFPTAIPSDADEVSDLETLYKGQKVQTQYGETTLWDIYAIYANKIVEGYNLKITKAGTTELGGNYQNASWDGTQGMNVAHPYNVYVDVEGDVTIRRVGATHFNLYILRGNVTLESNYGEQAGLISVAAGATLNDQRNSIAANQGVKLYNRGTVNATNTQKYDIGNFCKVYNEGKFNVSGPLTYSPGDANDSYFMNLGDDAELTAPAMTLNSTGNFFNSGKVTISGETNVTQARLYWVNAGHYTTGSMTFSAKNTTFYNYCQLIVTGNAHMYDGEFNLMQNSYTEAGTAEFDNFIVNMESNTGMYIKGNVRMVAQGDGTYQGYRTSGSNDYLLIDGTVTVDAHYHTFSISSGITYSINAIQIVRDGNVITDEYLQSIGDGAYPVLDLNGTECPYGQLTVTPNANSCGATWTTGTTPDPDPDPTPDPDPEPDPTPEPTPEAKQIWSYAFEDSNLKSDYDMNDVVIQVQETTDGTGLIVTLVAAGCEYDNEVYLNGNVIVWANGMTEVHEALYARKAVTLNTGGTTADASRTTITIAKPSGYDPSTAGWSIVPSGGDMAGQHIGLAQTGQNPCGIAIPSDWKWPLERRNICSAYPDFATWGGDPVVATRKNLSDWYTRPVDRLVYSK